MCVTLLPIVRFSAPLVYFDVLPLPDGHSLLAEWQLHYDGGAPIQNFSIEVSLVNIAS